jgi:DNA-binding NarL/FixJ family response regulator
MISVLIADDQALLRAALRALLEGEPDIEVVDEAADGSEAIALARRLQPDVVLMDISMPGIGGIAATKQIVADKLSANARVLILTTFETERISSKPCAPVQAGSSSKTPSPPNCCVRSV